MQKTMGWLAQQSTGANKLSRIMVLLAQQNIGADKFPKITGSPAQLVPNVRLVASASATRKPKSQT